MASITSSPTTSTTSSVACGGTDTVTGAKTSPTNASTSTAAFVPKTCQNSGSEDRRARMRSSVARPLRNSNAGTPEM